MSYLAKPLAERFSRYVKPGAAEECWMWTGTINPVTGYGQLGCSLDELGIQAETRTTVSAHRVAWILANGPVPDGLKVLHTCDTPPCCNPRHLFLGTQLDNMRDCVSKGRHRHGTTGGPKIHNPLIIEAAVVAYAAGDKDHRTVAKQFGISSTHLLRHVKRSGLPTKKYVIKITPSQAVEIRELYATGQYTYKSLSEKFGSTWSNIAQIVKYKSFKTL